LLIGWIAELVQRRGLTSAAEHLSYDPANLAKLLAGKRRLPTALRGRAAKFFRSSMAGRQ
jgi:hypothetical protein